jgi:hypothetical protein
MSANWSVHSAKSIGFGLDGLFLGKILSMKPETKNANMKHTEVTKAASMMAGQVIPETNRDF